MKNEKWTAKSSKLETWKICRDRDRVRYLNIPNVKDISR